MPVGVVDVLEVIEIDHQESEGLSRPVKRGSCGDERIVHLSSVVQTRQRVDSRLLLQEVDQVFGALCFSHARLELDRV